MRAAAVVRAALVCALLGFAAGCAAPPPDSSPALPSQDVVSGIRFDPALKAELPSAIAARGTIILGTANPDSARVLPLEGRDSSGRLVGLDFDLRDAVARKLGIRWDVRYGTFATIVPGVQNGRFDVGMSNFGVTKAREQVVDFATYLTDGQAFLGGRTVPIAHVSRLTDLCGLQIATAPGSTFQQILVNGATRCAALGKKPYTVQYFADTAPIYLGLENGRIDVFFGPTLGLKYTAQHLAGTTFLGQISSTPVGFVTPKGSTTAKALSDAVNELIASGDYARIFAKWTVPDTEIATSQVDPTPNF